MKEGVIEEARREEHVCSEIPQKEARTGITLSQSPELLGRKLREFVCLKATINFISRVNILDGLGTNAHWKLGSWRKLFFKTLERAKT